MSKIFVIAGHSLQQPGAMAYNGKMEHYYTSRLQKKVRELFVNSDLDVKVLTDDEGENLSKVIDWVNQNASPGDYLLDIHFNNNNPSASGTEVFVHPRTSGRNKAIADSIVKGISKAMDIPLRRSEPTRTYKYPSESNVGSLGIIERTTIPAILVEVCFLNSQDLTTYLKMTEGIAGIIWEAYRGFAQFPLKKSRDQ